MSYVTMAYPQKIVNGVAAPNGNDPESDFAASQLFDMDLPPLSRPAYSTRSSVRRLSCDRSFLLENLLSLFDRRPSHLSQGEAKEDVGASASPPRPQHATRSFLRRLSGNRSFLSERLLGFADAIDRPTVEPAVSSRAGPSTRATPATAPSVRPLSTPRSYLTENLLRLGLADPPRPCEGDVPRNAEPLPYKTLPGYLMRHYKRRSSSSVRPFETRKANQSDIDSDTSNALAILKLHQFNSSKRKDGRSPTTVSERTPNATQPGATNDAPEPNDGCATDIAVENDGWSARIRSKRSRMGFSSEQDLYTRADAADPDETPREEKPAKKRKKSVPPPKKKGPARVTHDYKDHSRLHSGQLDVYRPKRGGTSLPFPLRLHYVLSAPQGRQFHISWRPHGRAFKVTDPDNFVEHTLRKCFRQSKMTSFQRQLNLYGFHRITSGPDAGSYYHELMMQHRPDLCMAMKRVKVKGCGTKKATNPDDEPNFYDMEPIARQEEAEVSPYREIELLEEFKTDKQVDGVEPEL